MKKFFFVIVIGLFISCKQALKKNASEWISLFDGTSLNGWRAYNGDEMPPGWMIIDSVLTFTTDQIMEEDYDYKGSRDIIYGASEFDNFELYLEWKIPKGGNSGIFYHLKEGYDGPPEVAPEYQLLDDKNYEEVHNYKLKDWQKTGADYAMYSPDTSEKILNPIGEWNSSTIVFTPKRVDHWLNGRKVLSFIPWSEDWYERRNSGKWSGVADYAKYKIGFVGLQDHGSNLYFRNIKIKNL